MSFAEARLEPALQKAGLACRADSAVNQRRPRSIEHGIVDGGVAVPDGLVAPHGRGLAAACGCPGVSGSRNGTFTCADGVVHGIEHRQIVAALFGRSVDQAVGVDAWVALVGGDFVVQISFGIGPVPLRDHDIALHALRPRRRFRGQFAFRDAGGPIAEHLRRRAARRVERGRPSWRCQPARTARGASTPARANRGWRTSGEWSACIGCRVDGRTRSCRS